MEARREQNSDLYIHKIDTALRCLVIIAKMYGISAQEEQLQRAYVVDRSGMDTLTLLRASKEIGLKARKINVDKSRLELMPLPLIATLINNNRVIVVRHEQGKVALIDPYQTHPVVIALEKFLKTILGEDIKTTFIYK